MQSLCKCILQHERLSADVSVTAQALCAHPQPQLLVILQQLPPGSGFLHANTQRSVSDFRSATLQNLKICFPFTDEDDSHIQHWQLCQEPI